MKNITTLKKISQSLNLSISTVSRALKNHPDISQHTKDKVIELANTLEYEPNTYAIQLRTNNSKAFGLIVPTISNYFYDSFIAAVEEECRSIGYSVLILQSGDDAAVELNNLKICRQNRVSGIFVCVTPLTSDIAPFLKLTELNIPVIFCDKVPNFENFSKICVADAIAAKIAAEELLRKERKKILAFFGNENMSITRKRLSAFNKVFEREGKQAKLFCEFALSPGEARDKTYRYLSAKNKPDAVFCMSDEILTGTMKAIQQLGLKIPAEIAVISISNGFIPWLYHPEITYVETSGYKLGKLAITKMLDILEGNLMAEELTLDSFLVKGGSL